MCSNPCEFEVTCFRPESNRGPYGLLHFLSAALSTTELWMQTNNGTMDLENNLGNRIGDKITLSGVSFTMMLELNERYSDVTFRMFVVRSAKGDTPTSSTLWMGASGNKMLDTLNTERFSILFSKYVQIKAPNMGIDPTQYGY